VNDEMRGSPRGNDPYLQAEGQGQRARGSVRQVGEQVKDAGENVTDAFRR